MPPITSNNNTTSARDTKSDIIMADADIEDTNKTKPMRIGDGSEPIPATRPTAAKKILGLALGMAQQINNAKPPYAELKWLIPRDGATSAVKLNRSMRSMQHSQYELDLADEVFRAMRLIPQPVNFQQTMPCRKVWQDENEPRLEVGAVAFEEKLYPMMVIYTIMDSEPIMNLAFAVEGRGVFKIDENFPDKYFYPSYTVKSYEEAVTDWSVLDRPSVTVAYTMEFGFDLDNRVRFDGIVQADGKADGQ